MPGLGLRLYTDEDVDAHIAEQLVRSGYDVLGCRAAGNHNQGLSDEWQLTYAANAQRAILIYNIVDYVALDREWKEQGKVHFGIIAAENWLPLGQLVRRTQRHLDMIRPEDQYNVLLYVAALPKR